MELGIINERDTEKWCKEIEKTFCDLTIHQVYKFIDEFYNRIAFNTLGNTILHYTCYFGCKNILDYLINIAGWNINVKNVQGYPPLTYAIRNNNTDIVKVLLKFKAICTNKFYPNGQGPLHEAINCGFLDIVKMLIMAGVNVNDVDSQGHTALHFALKTIRVYVSRDIVNTMIDLLLDAGADANSIDSSQYTPLRYAVQNNYYDIVGKLLKRNANPNNFNILVDVIWSNNIDILKLLLDNGTDVNLTNSKKQSLLHVSCSEMKYDVVKLLLDRGADINYCDIYGYTPLCALLIHDFELTKSSSNYRQVLNLLLDRGAKVNHDNKETSPLYVILRHINSPELIEFLLERGAIFDYADKTVIEVLKYCEKPEIPGTLLKYTVMYLEQKMDDRVLNFNKDLLSEGLRSYYDSCVNEIEMMKCKNFKYLNDFLYNLLTKKIDNKSYVFMMENLDSIEESDFHFIKEFPIYGDILFTNLLDEYEKQHSLSNAKKD